MFDVENHEVELLASADWTNGRHSPELSNYDLARLRREREKYELSLRIEMAIILIK